MNDISSSEAEIPEAIELRYSAASIALRVVLGLMLAIGASILTAGFLQVSLLQAAARVGDTTLFAGWVIGLALFTLVVSWQSKSFILRVDANGIYRAAGWERRLVKWSDVEEAEAGAPANVAGQEYLEGLCIVLRDRDGRKLISLGYDIGRGLPASQVSAFKRYVRAQLNAHDVPKHGPPLDWINWA